MTTETQVEGMVSKHHATNRLNETCVIAVIETIVTFTHIRFKGTFLYFKDTQTGKRFLDMTIKSLC